MKRIESPYYPPRASWYRPLLRLGQALRRVAWLDRIHLPAGVSLGAFLLGLLLPGYAFVARRERLIGRAIMISYGFLALAFIVWLGFPFANLAFGLLLSLHVTSIIFLLNPWLAEARFLFRIAAGAVLLLLVSAGFYAPIRRQLETRLLVPVRISEHVVIVQTFTSAQTVKRGDWVAYSLAADRGAGFRTAAGLGLRPVLAAAGDRIRFTPQTFEVNGVATPRQPHMPTAGELVVPEKNWFIWPELAISGYGNNVETTIAATMLRLATVPETEFIGKPFKRWFWRRQVFS